MEKEEIDESIACFVLGIDIQSDLDALDTAISKALKRPTHKNLSNVLDYLSVLENFMGEETVDCIGTEIQNRLKKLEGYHSKLMMVMGKDEEVIEIIKDVKNKLDDLYRILSDKISEHWEGVI